MACFLKVRPSAFCALLPSAHPAHLLALSNLLLTPVPTKDDDGQGALYFRKLFTTMCGQFSLQDLSEVLKYPFCTGEAERIVLNAINPEFADQLWRFAEKADGTWGIKHIENPGKRPSVQDALNELGGLSEASADTQSQ